ncbi:DUF3906 family protein [Paenibacillus lemnae]|uniref:DUF3906 family protein n=1 Tax=Paenibacillus lemnae TaxID=1330551 RepID=A0A848M729_PAELE|nr:DUF3906 family protein [Paenibacillus lemnae]NMO95384.1 DUF3906 family protein [Paenibacillus lemnae]
MYLYRMEVTCDQGNLVVITAAENEEGAFKAVDEHVERHFLAMPDIQEVTMLEKKRMVSGTAYVIETGQES